MIKNKYTHYYDRQLYRYILQFMSIFSVMQVEVGKRDDGSPSLISVPIHYSSHDRITAAIIANNTQNSPIRLPAMGVFLKDIQMAPELRKGVGTERRNVAVPLGGLLPDDAQVIYQRQAVPYMGVFELSIHVSNADQQFQLIEQITSLFDPQVVLQISDNMFDPGRLTTVELTSIRLDDPMMQEDTRILQNVLTFNVPFYMQLPTDIRNNIVESIKVRVGIVDTATDLSADIVQQLTDEGFNYQTILDAAGLPFE